MKRPTIKQLNIVRGVVGNGWGDGDYSEWKTPSERKQDIRAIIAFEQWLERLQGAEFKSKLIGGK